MKILHILTSDSGGAATGAIRQHLALLESGINSKILCCHQNTNTAKNIEYFNRKTPKSIAKKIAEKIGFEFNAYDLETSKIEKLGKSFADGGTYELFSNPYSNYNINDHPLVNAADIINLHWTSGFLDIPAFLKANKKPIAWTLHDMYPYLGGFHYDIDLEHNPSFTLLEEYYKNIKIKALKNTKYAVVGNSKWNTQKATESEVFKNSKSFSTIYYPLLDLQFTPIKKSVAKNALNIPNNKFVIGFACENLSNPRKGYKQLLTSIDELPDKIKSNLILLSFGNISSNNSEFINLEIIQLGSIPNPKLQSIVYSAMDLFIIPSTAEAFGLTAMEAMACKTLVLGNNVGGIPEMIEDNKTGFLYDITVPNSFANNLVKVMEMDEEKRSVICENGFNHIQNQHNQSQIALQYKEIYQSLI